MWNDRFRFGLWDQATFDPVTLSTMSMAGTAIGGATTAAGTLAGGNYARKAGQMQQVADIQQGAEALASSQRQMLDTQDRTRMMESTITARAGASGVSADKGSPLTTEGDVAARGSYHALMDLFNGQSRMQQLDYQGELARSEGDMKQKAAYLLAAGTIAGTAGTMAQQYGIRFWPPRPPSPGYQF